MRTIVILLLFVFASVASYSQTPAASPKPKHKTKVESRYSEQDNETYLLIGPLGQVTKNAAESLF